MSQCLREGDPFVAVALTPGDYYDRLTISAIKLRKLQDRVTGEQYQSLRDDFDRWSQVNTAELFTALSSSKRLSDLLCRIADLFATHEELWDLEIRVREIDNPEILRGGPDWFHNSELKKQFAAMSESLDANRRIRYLNAERAEIKACIDMLFGVLPELKDYSPESVTR
jgi:hypothetical protein